MNYISEDYFKWKFSKPIIAKPTAGISIFSVQVELAVDMFRACVTTGARDAWHQRNFRTSHLAPSDFEVIGTNWHLPALFYTTDGTHSFKFLIQAKVDVF